MTPAESLKSRREPIVEPAGRPGLLELLAALETLEEEFQAIDDPIPVDDVEV